MEFNAQPERGAYYLSPGLYRRLPHRVEVGVGLPIGLSSRSLGAGIAMKANWESGGRDHQNESHLQP
jgi:hypothetical protein